MFKVGSLVISLPSSSSFSFFFFFFFNFIWSSPRGAVETNPTRNHEVAVAGSVPGLAPWVKDLALP